MDIIETDKKFNEAIGNFIIAFSQLEFGLVELCFLTEFNLSNQKDIYVKYLGISTDKKRKCISEYVNENLPALSSTWLTINQKIGQLNRQRRFIVHGIMESFIQNESIISKIKENNTYVKKSISLTELTNLTNQLHKINTGENGILGAFNIVFKTNIFNNWNKKVFNSPKVIYKIDNKIMTEFILKTNQYNISSHKF